MNAKNLFTLSTDFGSGSSYVAQMKGVILSRYPEATIIDIAHDLPAFETLPAEVLLRETVWRFPPGTVHVVVVDPGVGSQRRPLVARAGGAFFTGPDNGVLGFIRRQEDARFFHPRLDGIIQGEVAPTFHGRDIFVPLALAMAAGRDPEQLGPEVRDPVAGAMPPPTRSAGGIDGRLILADRFGNVTSNIHRTDLNFPARVELDGRSLRLVQSFYEAAPDELVALWGSDGYLEVAMNQASAADRVAPGAGISCLPDRS